MFKISESKPALLIFGALWCHPCLAEIEMLNRAEIAYGNRVEILGLFVEGPSKGSPIEEAQLELVQAPNGIRPKYRVQMDRGWSAFSELNPASGRLLPTLMFLDSQGRIVRVVQRSLDYESELALELELLIGNSPSPAPSPVASPSPTPGEVLKKLVQEWMKYSGAEPGSVLALNVEAGWKKGLEKFSFPEAEMPFESGQITFVYAKEQPPSPIQAEWVAEESGCRLTVKYFPDGTFKAADGVCSP